MFGKRACGEDDEGEQFEQRVLSKCGVGHIVVVFTIDFYEEKLDYVLSGVT